MAAKNYAYVNKEMLLCNEIDKQEFVRKDSKLCSEKVWFYCLF